MKRLQDEITKLKGTIEEFEEARTDQRVIQEKEEQNKEISKWILFHSCALKKTTNNTIVETSATFAGHTFTEIPVGIEETLPLCIYECYWPAEGIS